MTGEVFISGPQNSVEREAMAMIKAGLRAAASFLHEACEEMIADRRSVTKRKRVAQLIDLIKKVNIVVQDRYRVDWSAILDQHGLCLAGDAND